MTPPRYHPRLVGRIAQLARALPLQGRCRGFESLCAHHLTWCFTEVSALVDRPGSRSVAVRVSRRCVVIVPVSCAHLVSGWAFVIFEPRLSLTSSLAKTGLWSLVCGIDPQQSSSQGSWLQCWPPAVACRKTSSLLPRSKSHPFLAMLKALRNSSKLLRKRNRTSRTRRLWCWNNCPKLEGALVESSDKVDLLTDELTAAGDERDSAIAERDTAVAERDASIAEVEATKLRFDPEIQAAIAAAQGTAAEMVCAAGDAFGFDPSLGAPDVNVIAESVLDGLPEGTDIDTAALQVRADECSGAGQARAAQVALTLPKGDGLWTVGLEIAPGLWRSVGTGDSCYWKRSPDGSPDDIIDNHFGNAGGSVTIRPGEEFETSRCGAWEFAG